MTPAADYGSILGALIFAQEVTLLSYLAVRGARTADADCNARWLRTQIRSPESKLDDQPSSEADPGLLGLGADDDHLDDETRFLFDVVARENERIIQNIDALGNGLIAVAVGVIAVALFAADKWFELDPNVRLVGFFFLTESTVVALFGYLTSYFVGPDTVDVVRLRDFAVDFSESAAKTTLFAIADITRSAETNVVARSYKRAFIVLATLLTIVAVTIIIVGRALGGPSAH